MGTIVEQTLRISVLATLLIILTSCNNTDPPPADKVPIEPLTQFPANISDIFSKNCVNCHTDDNVGTFSLLPEQDGWENAVLQADAIAASVVGKTMPPFLADNSGQCNVFNNDFPMSSSDITAVTSWTAGGTPADVTGTVEMQLPQLRTLDSNDPAVVTLTMKEAYTPKGIGGQDNEDSRCFVIDALAETKILTAFEVIPGNTRVVHHVQLYASNNSSGNTQATNKENADSTAGYACYGDSGLAPANVSLVASWSPGTGANSYPVGTGIRIRNGNVFVMKVHYLVKNSTAPGPVITSMKLKLESAGSLKVAYISTLNETIDPTKVMNLPAGNPRATYTTGHTVAAFNPPATIHAVLPHMHDLGSKIKILHNSSCLIDIPTWQFEWQQFFFLKTPNVSINGGDTFSMQCEYNTLDNNSNVIWGQDKGEEHCLAYLYVVPN